jgi:diguanylate cyclase (GGDEF)-like protein
MTTNQRKSVIGPLIERFAAARKTAGSESDPAAATAAEELLKLRAALNEIDDGIILLDCDLRLEFINRAACEFAGAPMPEVGRKPTFADLIRTAQVTTFKDDIDAFIARRVETVRAGDPTPVELRFAGGKVVRARCAVLPDGSRLLTYSDLTGIVRRNEQLETLHAALDQAEYGVVLLDSDLRAQFINRAFRRMAEMPDQFANGGPTFMEILEHGRSTKAFAVPDTELESYIARRIRMIRDGDTRPIELRWSRDRVVRYQITALPGGGRMLTYTDITDLARTTDKLEKLATTDGLTGLCNRRQFITLADREVGRFRRYGRPLSMLVLDIDKFKSVNDRFGHDVGDQMIVHVGNICQENKRSPDVVARVGGEEFAILLPETDLESSCIVAERLRRMVAERPLQTGGTSVPVTISVGVAELNPAMTGTSDLMKLADRMLYEAKRFGRDRVASVNGDTRTRRGAHALAPNS